MGKNKDPKPSNTIEGPQPIEYEKPSEFHHANSRWYTGLGLIDRAMLEMQWALYHQRLEEAQLQLEDRREKRKTKLTSAKDSRPLEPEENDEEAALHRAHGDAVMVAKVFYNRARAKSPIKDMMPAWNDMRERDRIEIISTAKEAINVLDARRSRVNR